LAARRKGTTQSIEFSCTQVIFGSSRKINNAGLEKVAIIGGWRLGGGITVVPCVERFLLKVLGQTVPQSSQACKDRLKRIDRREPFEVGSRQVFMLTISRKRF
jgi:hypothetical protein